MEEISIPSYSKGGYGGRLLNNSLVYDTKNIIKELSVPITCPPGFIYCYEQTYTYGDAHAVARVYVSDPYIEGSNLYINYIGDGTKFYMYRGITAWSQVSCDSNGCNGTVIGSNGKILLGSAPSTSQPGIVFVVWDYNSYGSYWAWTWVGFGWFSPFNYDLRPPCTQPSCTMTIV